MLNSTLNKTRNYFRCVGTFYENGLKQEPCDIKLKDENGSVIGTTKGERIMGNIAVRTDNGICTFNVYFQNLTAKNEPNQQWKMATDMMNWTAEIGNTTEEGPTLVNIEGTVAINDYVGQDGEVKSGLRWSVRRANTKASPDETKGASLNAVAYIKSITPEVKRVGEESEETGRLNVALLGVDGNGSVFPINALVEEELASDFESVYEVGQTVNFDFDLIVRHVGGVQNKKKAFGRGSSVTVNSGYDVSELVIVGADEPIEEPEELTTIDDNGNEVEVKTQWLNPKAINKAIKAREQMLEELKNNPPEKKSNNNSFKDRKAQAQSRMSSTKKNNVPSFDDFGDDDDIF